MTRPNAELAYRVLDRIDADPASWNQAWWLIETGCGTTACFAGLTCVLSGDQPDFGDPDSPVVPGRGWTFSSTVNTKASHATVSWRAEQLLGIDEEQADRLFLSSNTRADLGDIVEQVFGPRPGVPAVTA